MANPEHLHILKEGVETWNRWRRERVGVEADLSDAHLRDIDLRGANLNWARLNEVELHGANFHEQGRDQ